MSGQIGRSRSLAIYESLLVLYRRAFLERHRAEMLQNFADLEQALPSKVALWLFIGKDLIISLRAHRIKSLWGRTLIILLVLAALLAVAHLHPGQAEHLIWGYCCGYLPAWFVGWFGKCWQVRSSSLIPAYVRSLAGQASVVLGALAVMLVAARGYDGPQEHVVWTLCYGSLLGWIAGWCGRAGGLFYKKA
jgi:hypothetical protein